MLGPHIYKLNTITIKVHGTLPFMLKGAYWYCVFHLLLLSHFQPDSINHREGALQLEKSCPHSPRVSEPLSTVSLTFLATLATASPIFLSMQMRLPCRQPPGWSAAHKGTCARQDTGPWSAHPQSAKDPPLTRLTRGPRLQEVCREGSRPLTSSWRAQSPGDI